MKRLFDLVISGMVLLLVAPGLLLLAILVRVKLGSPILFLQRRPGLNGQIFKVLKFRTMTDEKEESGRLLSDAKRLTPFGKWLRETSLDELPELWNIFCGEMSFVGPRPLLVEYLNLYSLEQARRHEMRPGLTGWAQINGRNTLTWDEKFQLDVWYVDHHTFWLDLKIIMLTAVRVFRRDGISAAGQATMTPFLGSQNFDRFHGGRRP